MLNFKEPLSSACRSHASNKADGHNLDISEVCRSCNVSIWAGKRAPSPLAVQNPLTTITRSSKAQPSTAMEATLEEAIARKPREEADALGYPENDQEPEQQPAIARPYPGRTQWRAQCKASSSPHPGELGHRRSKAARAYERLGRL